MSKSDTQNYDQARYAIDALLEKIQELESTIEEKNQEIQELQSQLDNISFSQ